MVVTACAILAAAFFLIMLSYLPWAQSNLKWLSNYIFIVIIGVVASAAVLYLIYRVMLALQIAYGE